MNDDAFLSRCLLIAASHPLLARPPPSLQMTQLMVPAPCPLPFSLDDVCVAVLHHVLKSARAVLRHVPKSARGDFASLNNAVWGDVHMRIEKWTKALCYTKLVLFIPPGKHLEINRPSSSVANPPFSTGT